MGHEVRQSVPKAQEDAWCTELFREWLFVFLFGNEEEGVILEAAPGWRGLSSQPHHKDRGIQLEGGMHPVFPGLSFPPPPGLRHPLRRLQGPDSQPGHV